ncbi:MAG: c-type cytochrome [Fuerstiella sp.]|nr:c-type cytochrome [Fuerstiella sp.]
MIRPFIENMSGVLVLLALLISGVVAEEVLKVSRPLEVGDVIKFDLSNSGDRDGGLLTDWNQLSDNGSIPAGSVIRHKDQAKVRGVTIQLAGRSGNNNDGNAADWNGIGTDPYYIAATDDVVFSGPGPLTVSFGGLDPGLNYNVRVYSLIDEDRAPIDVAVTDGTGIMLRTGLNRSSLFSASPLSEDLIFNSVASDSNGNINISIDSTGPISAEAIVLEAVVPTAGAMVRRQKAAATGHQHAATLDAMKGRDGLIAVPLMSSGALPRRLMGVGVSSSGTVYVTETVRQAKEEISLLQSRFLQPLDMGFTSVEQKRNWIEQNYSPQIARSQGMPDLNGDQKVNVADLVIRSERIFTLQDADRDGLFDQATLFADGFNDIVTGVAHSVAPIGDDVYATIIPDLWKLTDSNGDGRADRRTSVAHGFAPHFGYGNHDLHSVVQAYDGRIYWSMGDRGVNVLRKDGKRVSYPHTGSILRCNPDGSEFEVFASGLRNCQYFDFDAYGNLFAIDHDADFQGEQERLVYIPEGSDSGWRNYYQYRHSNRVLGEQGRDVYSPWLSEVMWKPLHDGQPSHFLPPIENSWNAPAAFSFQPGTALGGKYKDHFLLGGSGNIRAFKMVADGAGFARQGEDVVVQGFSEQVLSSAFGPDGRLYFVLWEPQGKSPLWALQVGDDQESSVAAMTDVKVRLSKGFKQEPVAALLALLDHVDRRIRQGAQFELVARGEVEELRALVIDIGAPQLPRLHSLWALGQLEDRNRAMFLRISQDGDPELRAQVARWAGNLEFDPDDLLPKLLKDPSPRVQMFAAIAAGKLKSKNALDPLTDLLVNAANKTPVLRHAGISGLVGVATNNQLQSFATHPSTAMRIAAVVALRQRRAAVELLSFLHDVSPQVVADAVRGIYDEATPDTFREHPEVLETLAALLSAEHGSAVNVRALAANRRLGTVAAVKRIAEFLDSPQLDRLERLEALNTLSSWSTDTVLDPVDGRHFPLPAFGREVLEVAFGEGLWTLSKEKDDAISQKAIAILATLKPSAARWQQVAKRVMDQSESEAVRGEWLRWLRLQDSDRFVPLGIATLAEKSAVLRRAAAEQLLSANGAEKEVEHYLLSTLNESQDTFEVQYALSRLSAVSAPQSILLQYLDDLHSGKLAPELHLDVLEAAAALADTNEQLQRYLDRHRAQVDSRGPLAEYDVVLKGGNPDIGKSIFLGHAKASCSKCHALSKSDQQVGPSLQGITTRHPISYLLQSLVDPQAVVAKGYSTVTLLLENGQSVAGTVMDETAEILTLKLSDGRQESYAKTAIDERSKPSSTMPDIKTILSKRELRDLVAYLGTLR